MDLFSILYKFSSSPGISAIESFLLTIDKKFYTVEIKGVMYGGEKKA